MEHPKRQDATASAPTAAPSASSGPPILQLGTELTLKLATASVGVLFILGLLISNIQLMELGIADFTSLQSRNIAVGFLFLIYAVFWALPLSYLGLAVYLHARFAKKHNVTGVRRASSFVAFLAVGILTAAMTVAWASAGIGVFYAAGPTIAPDTVMEYFNRSFGHLPVLLASMAVIISIMYIPLLYANFTDPERIRSSAPWLQRYVEVNVEVDDKTLLARVQRNVMINYALLAMVIVVPMVLYTYATEVYPNLRYNLGGGQPQIAALILGGKKSELEGFSGKKLCCDDATTKSEEVSLQSKHLAIWHQSDKFLYVAELPEKSEGALPLVAIDLKLVRAIRYVRKYVTISSGGRIVSVDAY